MTSLNVMVVPSAKNNMKKLWWQKICYCWEELGFNKWKKEGVEKLIEVAFYDVLKGHSFTEFREQIDLEQLCGVKYTGIYEMRVVLRTLFLVFLDTFLKNLSWLIFWLFFMTILLTKPLLKKEVMFVIFIGPGTFKPVIKVLEIIATFQGHEA